MPLAELYPYVDNSDMKGPDFAAYERMTNSLCHRMGIGETEKRRDQVFAILAQDRGAASLTASLDEGFPDSTNIVTQIQWPIGVQLKGHMFLVMHARDHVGGLIIAAGRTDRLLDQDVGQEPHKLHVRRKIEELMRRDNITQDQVQQIIVKGPVARWTSTTAWGESVSRATSTQAVHSALKSAMPAPFSSLDPLEDQRAYCTAGKKLDHCRIIIIANAKESKIPGALGKPDFELRAFTIEVPAQISRQEFHALVGKTVVPSGRVTNRAMWVYGFCKVAASNKEPELRRNLRAASSVLRCLDKDDYKHLCYVAVGGELQDLNVLCIIALQGDFTVTKPAKEKKRKRCVVS